jgi:hypothetical protein
MNFRMLLEESSLKISDRRVDFESYLTARLGCSGFSVVVVSWEIEKVADETTQPTSLVLLSWLLMEEPT